MQFIPQHDQMDCGPACLGMIASHYGKKYPMEFLREKAFITKEGVSLLGLTQAAESIGMETFSAQLTLESLKEQMHILPCILHWNQNHFVVLRKIRRSGFSNKWKYHILDPAHGPISLSEEHFKKAWLSNENTGISLFLGTSEAFFTQHPPKNKTTDLSWLFSYLKGHRFRLLLMFALLLLSNALSLLLPFLTQNLIDKGVIPKDISYIWLILTSQLAVFIGFMSVDVFRNALTLYIGTHVSIEIISDFFKKMMQLPIKFFDTKMMGDFNQRIQDNNRIESFLTSQSLVTFFSVLSFLVFFGILWYYDIRILLLYLSLTVLSILWSVYWLRSRKILDYFAFQQRSENQESIYEMLSGVVEMKINRFEDFKIKAWQRLQQKLFRLNVRILRLDQIQLSGFEFINQLKNIGVTFLAAHYVVSDRMTLGALLGVSYIIGQMNGPINQLISFFRSLQDARLSLDRLQEVQENRPEEQDHQLDLDVVLKSSNLLQFENQQSKIINQIASGIYLKNVFFQYEGPKSPYVLSNINLLIPNGKITALVGASGSGKTTLMKLLLSFYLPTQGNIYYQGVDLSQISPKSLRKESGMVMQEGFLFNDSLERNIAMSDETIDPKRLHWAIDTANISDFVQGLPLGLKTKWGNAGNGLSGGQKQRLLIARAVYKNPRYLFLDEATSALDAENEKIIHDNLQVFFKGKTVLIIAHRLSTVKNAHNIVVLDKGHVVEQGTHDELTKNQKTYYCLIKNQLELG